jgi:hypothetical protein
MTREWIKTLLRISFRLDPEQDPRDLEIYDYLERMVTQGFNKSYLIKELLAEAIRRRRWEEGRK